MPRPIRPTNFHIPHQCVYRGTVPKHSLQGFTLSSGQVSNAKNPKPKKETSEEVVPKTVSEALGLKLQKHLKASALARSNSITLSGLEFADDLAKALLKQAGDMEQTYKKAQRALKEKKSDKELKKFIPDMENQQKAATKLQAGV